MSPPIIWRLEVTPGNTGLTSYPIKKIDQIKNGQILFDHFWGTPPLEATSGK